MIARVLLALILLLGLIGLDRFAEAKRVVIFTHPYVNPYVGVGDIASGWSWYYSCTWGYSAAYATPGTNKACTIRRASGGTFDIVVQTNGTVNEAAAASFCNATSCFVTTAYNQSGSTVGDLTQATAGLQPQVSFSAVNGHLVLLGDGVTDFNLTLSSIGTNAQAQPLSSIGMASTANGNGGAIGTAETTGTIFGNPGSGISIALNCGSGISVALADTNPHAYFMLANSPTSSFIRKDATSGTAGDCGIRGIANNETIGIMHFVTGFSFLNGQWGEWGVKGGDLSANANALITNIKTTRWGF